jgi:hypothetical protein
MTGDPTATVLMTGDPTATQDSSVRCETLEEAERVAHICAAYQQPCELVRCDAYHRMLHQELIDANTDQAAQVPGLLMLAAERVRR